MDLTFPVFLILKFLVESIKLQFLIILIYIYIIMISRLIFEKATGTKFQTLL